jgi:type I restriction enzyme S subunit
MMTGRKPTFKRGHIVYGYLRPYLNKVWVADFDGCSSVDQFAFDVNPELASRHDASSPRSCEARFFCAVPRA